MKRGDIPEKYNAVDILERNLVERASALALLSGERSLTFQQVSDEANRIGNALLQLGVKRNDHVAILCLDSPEWVAAFFGTIKIGAVVASLNTLLTAPEYAYQLNDCHARVLFVHHSLLDKITEVRGQLPELLHVVVIGGDVDTLQALLRDQPRTLRAADTLRDDLCCLNYSSGTTGEPKGIHHSHADLPLTAQLVGVNVFGLTAQDRTYAVARLFFTFGTGGNLIFPWYVGASIIVSPESPRDPKTVLKILARHRPTVLFNVPTGYASLLGVEGFPAQYELSSLRLCVSAGEALPEALWERWKAATGLELVDGIGTTENYHIFICNRPGQIRPGSSGRPVDGYEVKLLAEDGRPVPAGEVGDLYVRGETAALCYWRKYFASRRAFEGEWLRTGDKYRADADGYYWFAGRADDMLKVGGIWVSPTEVENGLLFHPAVEQCAVVGQQDGSGLTKPMAFVVLKAGYEPSAALERELIEFTTKKMAAYKRPRWLEFVAALPKTATGKIQRFRLRSGAA